MRYPKIYLVLDNCFAIKRWVKPKQWMELGKELGATYMQASCDNEIDPFYCEPGYRQSWIDEVKKYEKELGIRVCNFYTGYQTYRTLGLAHEDQDFVKFLQDGWFTPMLDTAAALGAGIGFYMVYLDDETLQNPQKYAERMEQIYAQLDIVAQNAKARGVEVGMEQMYNPAAPPWTIEGGREFLKNIYGRSQSSMYLTIDVGHAVGQHKFVKPDKAQIMRAYENGGRIYLGAEKTRLLMQELEDRDVQAGQAADELLKSMEAYPYLFSRPEDGDTYAWMSELACYSPIIHLQQTDGVTSHHAGFTEETNKTGIITCERVLESIKASYDKEAEAGMPPRVENIYLSFEVFSGNTETRDEALDKIRQSIAYWRQAIPADGLSLDEITG